MCAYTIKINNLIIIHLTYLYFFKETGTIYSTMC